MHYEEERILALQVELTSRSVSGAAEYIFISINNLVEFKMLDESCLCHWVKSSSSARFPVGIDHWIPRFTCSNFAECCDLFGRYLRTKLKKESFT